MPPAAPPRRTLRPVRLLALLGGAVLLLGGLFAAHRVQLERQVGTWKDRADAAARDGNPADAAEFYKTYLGFRPDDADAVAGYAAALEQANADRPGATGDLVRVSERLLRLDPDRPDARRKVARWYLDQRQLTNARDHLTYLLEHGSAGDPEVLGMLATCDARERKFDAARANLEKAVATGTAPPDTVLALAALLRDEIKSADATAEADRVMNALVAARPADLPARLARVKYRLAVGDADGAAADLAHAATLPGAETNPDVLLARADVANRRNDPAAARASLEKAAAVTPDDLGVRLALADAQARANDRAGAVRTLRSIADTAGKPTVALLEAADRLVDLGDPDAATKYAERFAAEPGLQPFADYLLGRAKLAGGDWPAALGLLAKAAASADLQRVPGVYLKAQLGQAECHAKAGNPDRRLAVTAAPVRAFPDSPAARAAHADSLARIGKPAEAAALYPSAADPTPATRAAFARLKLAETLAQPPAARNWPALDAALGPKPYPADVALVHAAALEAQGKPADAATALEDAIARFPADARPRVALAGLKSATDLAAGLAVLDAIPQQHVPAIRLAKAQLLARAPNPDSKAIRQLASIPLRGEMLAERGELRAGIAAVLAGLGDGAAAVELYRGAAADRPFDLTPRAALFDLGLALDDPALRADARRMIAALEGPAGPIGLAADVAAGLPDVKPGDAAAVSALRAKLKAATDQRESWPRLYALAGDLDQLDGQPDAALDSYRKALDLGDRSPALARKVVQLLLARGLQSDALATLDRFDRESALPPDLRQQLTVLRSMAGQDPAKGLAWAESAAGKDSANYRDHLARAVLFALADRRTDAEAALRKAVALDPAAPEARVALVRFLAAVGRADDAKAAFADAAEKLPAAAGPNAGAAVPVALGACLEALGDAKGAEAQYRTAAGRFPADPAAVRALSTLLIRTNHRAEGEAVLRAVADAPGVAPAVRRWARRTLALAIAEAPDGYSRLRTALDLLDQNLADGNHPDDQRAKAVAVAADPFRRAEAVELLTAAAARTPLNPEENALLARLHLRGGRSDLAVEALTEAARSAGPASADVLGSLVRVELARGNPTGAKAALDRLKALAPGSWDTVAAEARYVATTQGKSAAEAVLKAWPGSADPRTAVALVGPLCEDLGLAAAAEAAYRTALAKSPGPAAHAPLAGYLLRAGRAADALALARDRQPVAPPGLTARLMSGAVRVRPPALLPASERPAWEKEVTAVRTWIHSELGNDPANVEIGFAVAELFDAEGKIANEIALYEQALKAFPESEVVLNNLAVLLALSRTGDPGRPLELVNRAIAKAGPRPHLLDSRAVVHLAAGRSKEAVDDLDAAIGESPRAVYFFHLAQVRDKLGEARQRDEALAEARKNGLAKAALNPLEWPAFDALTAGTKP